MRMHAGGLVVVTLLSSSLLACSKQKAEPPKFVPGAAKVVESPEAKIRLKLPDNMKQLAVTPEEGGRTRVEYGADGFPGKIAVVVTPTEDSSMTGTGKECTMGECTYKAFAPCRKITCEPRGAFQELAEPCETVESTFQPAMAPGSAGTASMGMTSGCDKPDDEALHALDADIDALKPKIEACVGGQAARPRAGGKGDVVVRLERNPRAPAALVVKASDFEGDTAALVSCVDALLPELRARLPKPASPTCSAGLDHHFYVEMSAVCVKPAP